MATEYGKRLKEARAHAKLTQVQLSKITGIAQSTISTAERNGSGSLETVSYAIACRVSPEWLATGNGPMEPYGEALSPAPSQHSQPAPAWGSPPSIEQVMRVLADALTASDDLSRELSASILKALTQDPSRIDELAAKLETILSPPKKNSPEFGTHRVA
jgi:transcriptional regulator with XRE-family HTH domain